MSKFTVQKIELPEEVTPFYTLVINGVNQMELFRDECKRNSRDGYFKSASSYVQSVSLGRRLSPKIIEPMKGIGADCL